MNDQHIGHIIDALGVTTELRPDDMPVDALVILKVVRSDGTVGLIKARSETLDWINALGMLTAAAETENSGYEYADDDE